MSADTDSGRAYDAPLSPDPTHDLPPTGTEPDDRPESQDLGRGGLEPYGPELSPELEAFLADERAQLDEPGPDQLAEIGDADTDETEDADEAHQPPDLSPEGLEGLSAEEVEARVPDDWVAQPSKSGNGTIFRDPDRPGRQIRLMPGYPPGTRPDPVTWGPYAVVSENGKVSKIPLKGNPTL